MFPSTQKLRFQILGSFFIVACLLSIPVLTLALTADSITTLRNQIVLIFLIGLPPLAALSIGVSSRLTRSLQNAELKTNSIIEAAGDAILLLDNLGKITKANDAATKLFGYEHQEILNQPVTILAPLEKRNSYNRIVESLCTGKRSISARHIRLNALTQSDKIIPIEMTVSQGPETSATKLIILCHDASERQKSEQKTKNIMEQQARLLEAQKQFINVASHEFRTPLSIISNSVQHLERAADKIERNYLYAKTAKIRMAVSRMLLLLQSTASLSNIEQGEFKLNLKEANLRELLEHVHAFHQDISKQHKIHLSCNNLPETIKIDPAAIEQVLNNLISNAIKYSPEADDIHISADSDGEDVTITIQDHGHGIAEKDLPNLFNRFFRAENSIGVSGTGMGLHLAKLFTDMHEGNISVTSQIGSGSTFSLKLPIVGPTQIIDDNRKQHQSGGAA